MAMKFHGCLDQETLPVSIGFQSRVCPWPGNKQMGATRQQLVKAWLSVVPLGLVRYSIETPLADRFLLQLLGYTVDLVCLLKSNCLAILKTASPRFLYLGYPQRGLARLSTDLSG